MAKKSDDFFFNNFIKCSEYACKSARMLEDILTNFDKDTLPKQLDEVHEVEHGADTEKHRMKEVLVKAFITPIEREDIMMVSQNIDDVVDCIEDVIIRLYINNVSSIRPGAIEFAKLIIRCCDCMKEIMENFSDFKKSKILNEKLIEVNALEEEGDKLFLEYMHKLHTECSDPLEIIAWREIYIYLEKCTDSCEHVADVIEEIVMKNS